MEKFARSCMVAVLLSLSLWLTPVSVAMGAHFKVERVAPSHCTSELGFAVFLATFNERFDHAGLGAVIPLPD